MSEASLSTYKFAKQTFRSIFILVALALAGLPFLTILNDLLTRFVLKFNLFQSIENLIVPFYTKAITVVLRFLGIPAQASTSVVMLPQSVDILPFKAEVLWNCVGWQTALLLFLTFLVGFAGPFKLTSKIQTLILGILGTFLFSLFRLSLIFIIGFYFGRHYALFFHNYISTILSLIWLFVFWWFAYSFVLETKATDRADL
jgi:exosortase/archaeosortase family protein